MRIQIRFLKIVFYSILGLGILIASIQLVNYNIYPWLQVVISLFIPLISLAITELIEVRNKHVKQAILITAFIQLVLSLIVLLNPELVFDYWNFLFFPSILMIAFATYEVCQRKSSNYHMIFNLLLGSILFLSLIRFFYYHFLIDYSIEVLFLVLIILIYRSKNDTKVELGKNVKKDLT